MLKFDPEGRVLELNHVSGTGEPLLFQEFGYEGDARKTPSIVSQRGRTGQRRTGRREIVREGPHGPMETRRYADGDLFQREEMEYSDTGCETERRTFNPEGRVTSITTRRCDAEGRELEFKFLIGGRRLHQHRRHRFGSGGEQEVEWMDAAGAVIRRLKARGNEVLEYWQSPTCRCHNNSISVTGDHTTVNFIMLSDGRLRVETSRHPGQSLRFEPEEEEVRDRDGKLLDRVVYRYERDDVGNWTTRTVSVWDPATDKMVDVLRHNRVITYY